MTGAGIPAEWAEVETKAARVERVDPGEIQEVARQFEEASRNASDHTSDLTNAAAPLQDGCGQTAADAFFDTSTRSPRRATGSGTNSTRSPRS